MARGRLDRDDGGVSKPPGQPRTRWRRTGELALIVVVALLLVVAVGSRGRHPASGFRLAVTPSVLVVGTPTTLTLRATYHSGTKTLPAADAVIGVGSRRLHANKGGVAHLRLRIARPGALTARLIRPAGSTASLRVVQRLYVDCSRRGRGNGSAARPWNSLRAANAVRLAPGAALSLRRGTVCRGFLAPRGSGLGAWPIVIGAYGHGRPPRISTDGAAPDAVTLRNESNIVLQQLELTNHGDYRSTRRGVHVVAAHGGSVRNVTLRDLYIHDVEGADNKNARGSAGIQVDAPTAGILIERNRVEDVNRSGIWVAGSGRYPRPDYGQPWPSATTGVVIRDNVVMRVGGDGIVPTGTLGAVVSGNVVCCGNLRGPIIDQFNAGIWTFDANETVIEHNVVYRMHGVHFDGTGYDVDYDQDGTVVQDNYGYDNAGGFILLCLDTRERKADVRFNLSVDEDAIKESRCLLGFGPGSLDDTHLYGNTFVLTSSGVHFNNETAPRHTLVLSGSFQFTNNIVYATAPQRQPLPCGQQCTHNLFAGLPASGDSAVVGDPRFADPSAARSGGPAPPPATAFKLLPGSPALGAGVGVDGIAAAGGPTRDYFGDPIPDPPNIGFFQGR